MQTNIQANVAGSPVKPEVLKDNQFRIDAVPAGSGLLVGDAAVFNVAAVFVPHRLNAPIAEAH